MEKNINVAKILKSKSKGTKLYSSAFGQMTYNGVAYDINGTEIWLLTENKVDTLYLSDGKYREGGEVTLYPSKEMRDWNKFSWKKGDILVSNDSDCHIIFEGFSKDDYTTFKGKHWVSVSKKRHISFMIGMMILIPISMVSITLIVKIKITLSIMILFFVQLEDILLKIRMLLRPTSTP